MEDLANVPSEGAKLEIDQALDRLSAKENSSGSQPKTPNMDKPSQEGLSTPDVKPEPFHKHPRWIQTQKELKETREKLAAFEASRNQTQPTELPAWWKQQYGETEDSKQRYQAVIQKDGELDWIKQNILNEIEQRSQNEQTSIKQGEDYVSTQIQEMQDEDLKFERNALLKFMVDFQAEFGSGALLDSEGNYDFRKSLTLMEKLHPEGTTPNIQKQIASLGSRGKVSAERQGTIPVVTRRSLSKGNWRDAESGKFISR